MYGTPWQNRYFIVAVFETIHFSLFAVWFPIFSTPVLKTVHIGYINEAFIVCSVAISRSPSLLLITYLRALPHFSTNQVRCFTEVSCRKADLFHAHERIQEVQLQQKGLDHTNISIYKHIYSPIPFTAFFLYLSLCAFQLWQIISIVSIWVKVIIRTQRGSTERRNSIAAPNHEHYTTSCTKWFYFKPLSHGHLRPVIQCFLCESVVIFLVHCVLSLTHAVQLPIQLIQCCCAVNLP